MLAYCSHVQFITLMVCAFRVMLYHNIANTKLQGHVGHFLEFVEEDLMMTGWVDSGLKLFEPCLFT